MLINLRNALMSGKRLPYDAEVEYLQSSGTQRIDTGIIAKPKTVSDITFRWVGTQSGDAVILGARNNSSSAPRFILLMTNATKIRQIGAGAKWLANGYYAIDTDYNAVTSFEDRSQSQKLDGSAIITGTQALDNLGINLYLFAINQTGSFISYASARLYSCKIYQDDVLVRDFIPVRVGTVGYLYDRVSGKLFGNAGTGDFVLGPDVVPVEYIESHGTEYIDTGVVPTATKTEITFSTPTPPSSGYMCGSFNANNNRYYPVAFSGSSTKYIDLRNADYTVISQYTNDGNVHTVVYNATGGACYFDGEAAGTLSTTTLTASNPIYLFCASGASGFVSGHIYSCKLYDVNDTPVRKFRPVRVGAEGAMMDVLTRRIYRNAGTGAFTYGNDLKYPIPAA